MGLGGISIWQLAIILLIVVLIFGTSKLRKMGGDLGGAVKGFKKAIEEDKQEVNEEVSEKATQEEAEPVASDSSQKQD